MCVLQSKTSIVSYVIVKLKVTIYQHRNSVSAVYVLSLNQECVSSCMSGSFHDMSQSPMGFEN